MAKTIKPTPFREGKPTTAICSCCARHIHVQTRLKLENQSPAEHLPSLTFTVNSGTFEVHPQCIKGEGVTEQNEEVWCRCGATFTDVMVIKIKDINVLILL